MNEVIDVDNLNLIVSVDQLFWINICLGFLMFGVALDIKLEDFKALFKTPRPILTGLASQLVLLPFLTFLLVLIIKPHPGIALGMMLVAACPGGNISNFLVHLAKGNVALSVTLTSITTVTAFLITPLNLVFWGSQYEPTNEILKQFQLDPGQLIWILVQLVLIPLIVGLFFVYYLPGLTQKIKKAVEVLSMLIFFGIIIGALISNADNLLIYVKLVFLLVLVHNGIAFAAGWFFSKAVRLDRKDSISVCIETGIQNSGLGIIIIYNFYDGMGSMVLVAAWWAIWHLIAGFALAGLINYRSSSILRKDKLRTSGEIDI
jgi:BASS family bile acid:Na+ symporter